MNKNISWYIERFFHELRAQGIKSAIYKSYRHCGNKILSYCPLPAPRSQRISLLRTLSLLPFQARRKARCLIGHYLEGSCSLSGAYTIPHSNERNFADEEVVLLAHWDPENIVDSYVLYMARHLKQLGKKIILCSAAPLAALPQETDIFDAIVCRTCAGYDFTSWKAAFEAFPSLYEAAEVTLCNDSVFAPIGSYAPVYQTMASIPCDFWGMSFSHEIMPHMQSFHLVLRKKALQHTAFKHFIAAVAINDNRDIAVGYEVRFSLWLELHGLKAGCYRPYNLHTKIAANPTVRWEKCLRDGIPLLKRELFKANGCISALPAWQDEVEKYHYPAYLISEYFHRIGLDISSVLCPGKRSATWPPSVFARYKPLQLSQEKSWKGTLRTAAIIHCYYPEGFSDLLKYLKNLPSATHIYISTDTEEKRAVIQRKMAPLDFAKTEIRICPNKGWGIAPFLAGFADIIPNYDLICKVHVKASTHLSKEKSAYWRMMLYGSLLDNKQHVKKIIRLFEDRPELGMIASPSLPYWRVDIGMNKKQLIPLLRKMGIEIISNEAIDFPVGSMFWARSAALQPLLDLQLGFEDFEDTDLRQRDGTLAHAIERSFLFSCCKAGYYWGRINFFTKNYG